MLAPVRAMLARSVNPNPESVRVLVQVFVLGKRPSKLGRALLNEREVHREQKRPKIAENFAHAGTKLPVSSVNPKARNFEVEISGPLEGLTSKTLGNRLLSLIVTPE